MMSLKSILFPTDFSENSAEAARYACELVDRFRAELHVLHVIHDVSSALPDFGMGLAMPALRENLGDRKDRLEADAIGRLTKVLPAGWERGKRVVLATRFGAPFVEIIRYAREHNCDLIVLGTHGRTGLPHALLGSVAEKVIRKSPCPVLSVRPPQHAFVPPTESQPAASRPANSKTAVRHAIEELYGVCPSGDFPTANAWAHGIDWERVKTAVEREHADFEWKSGHPGERDPAEAMIADVRHSMLHAAGHRP
ncbi:MAG: universal stress protein [Planctomycetaceae bacterium]